MKNIFFVISFILFSVSGMAYAQSDGPTDAPVTEDAASMDRAAVGKAEDEIANDPSPASANSQNGAQVAPQRSARGFTALAPIPGLTDDKTTSVVNSKTLADFFNNLYKYLIGLAAALAVVMIVWGGIEYATQDVPFMKTKGKERIQGALFGLVLILSPYIVFSIINPSILNLSIGLPALDTRSGNYAPSPTIQQQLPVCNRFIKKNCIPGKEAAFNEGYYLIPPVGSYCFKLDLATTEGATAAGGRDPTATPTPYYCAKNQTGVAQSCRVALVSYCPTSAKISPDGTGLTGSCPGLATTCAPY